MAGAVLPLSGWEIACAFCKSGSRAAAVQKELATTYELDDFQAVAVGDPGAVPLGFGEDLEIVFDSDAAAVEPELREKNGDGGALGSLAGLAVDLNGDGISHILSSGYARFGA
jgi:hypothetical protein